MFNHAVWVSPNFYTTEKVTNENDAQRSGYVRRAFSLTNDAVSATLTICALGLGDTYINGKSVTSEVLSTPYTNYSVRVIASEYDVSHLLKKGENVIAVHIGNGFYNNNMKTWKDDVAPWRSHPKVIFSIKITTADGETVFVDSDLECRGHEGPVLYNHMRQGQIYDAREAISLWNDVGLNDASWQKVREAEAPTGTPELMDFPRNYTFEEYSPVSFNNGIYDFGVNISGWVKIRVKGERGQKIKLAFDEALKDEGRMLRGEFPDLADEDRPKITGSNAFSHIEALPLAHEEYYILSGDGWEEYYPAFCYHGFRYLKVTGAPEDFEVKAVFVHTDLKERGSFKSDNPILNEIHTMTKRTLLSNYMGFPTDCPHREQNGWTGDALTSFNTSFLNFHMYEAYRKWMYDIKDAQLEDGRIPGIAPSAGGGYKDYGPCWDSAFVMLPYFAYIYTGKKDMIREFWDALVRFCDYIYTRRRDGLIRFGCVDWCGPRGYTPPPAPATSTAYIYTSFVTMGKMARLIGEDGTVFDTRAEEFRNAYRRAFLEDEECLNSQTFLATSIYHKLLTEAEEKDFASRLARLIEENGDHISCGMQGSKAMFTALTEHGYAELLYRAVVNPTYPSYAYLIENGMTTLTEHWHMSNSLNHHMFSEVDNWLYRYVGGIRHTDEGLVIAPVPLSEVGEVEVTLDGIRVKRVGDRLSVTLSTPARIVFGSTDGTFPAGKYEFEF